MSGRLLVLGDVHGAYRALKQVFERASFDYEYDRLIFVGDVADGWPETRQCIDELLKVKNLVALMGNHDEWFFDWAECGAMPSIWTQQGGKATIQSYGDLYMPDTFKSVPQAHRAYLWGLKHWHQEGNRIFVHGGFEGEHPMTNSPSTLMWDRELWHEAYCAEAEGRKATKFDEVYIGHTQCPGDKPAQMAEVWNVDQGAGWGGKLTLMDVDTKEFWQSDIVRELYPEHGGRFAA